MGRCIVSIMHTNGTPNNNVFLSVIVIVTSHSASLRQIVVQTYLALISFAVNRRFHNTVTDFGVVCTL